MKRFIGSTTEARSRRVISEMRQATWCKYHRIGTITMSSRPIAAVVTLVELVMQVPEDGQCKGPRPRR